MTLQGSDSNSYKKRTVRLRNEPYLVINIFLAASILVVLIYSAVFSPEKNNYPVVCVHEKITGVDCASCGLSHSFSLILRGRIDEASAWNKNGMRVFLFFAAQLLLRAIFSVLYIAGKPGRGSLITIDSGISAALFLVAFMPYITWLIKLLSS